MDENAGNPKTGVADCDAIALAEAREEAAVWQARAAYLQAQMERASAANSVLQQQNLTLESQLRSLEAYASDLQSHLAQAQSLVDAARTTVSAAPLLSAAVAQPTIVDIVAQLPRSSDPANRYEERPLAQIRQVVLHHSGSPDLSLTPRQMAEFHVNDLKHQWPGIGFHFFVAADGTIYQTNRLETVCFHVANSNSTTAGIVLAGQFEDSVPTAPQMESIASLLAWLLQELHLPMECITGHSELADQQTTCPGAQWQTGGCWKDALLEQVRLCGQIPRRPIYHYVLFSQADEAWAEGWQAAARYIARFRPTVGFSVQEASQAQNVTIVGGLSEVPREAEAALHSAGCRVRRVAGKNRKETRSLLDGMAREGQRFPAT
jgi:N-acetylmuramoyl-L-alanine amidase